MKELIHLDRDAELWGGSKLTQRLISILQELVTSLKGKKLTSFFYSDYSLFKRNSLDVDCSNAAAIIQILVDRLFKKLPEYDFEDCLKKIARDLTIICRKKKLTILFCTVDWAIPPLVMIYLAILQRAIEK